MSQLQFEQKIKIKDRQLRQINDTIVVLEKEQYKHEELINKKEDRVEVDKVFKEVEIIKAKNTHFQKEYEITLNKIEKIQILNQKAERVQAKKDIQFMKEI